MMFCPKCGAQLPEEAIFCSECGLDIVEYLACDGKEAREEETASGALRFSETVGFRVRSAVISAIQGVFALSILSFPFVTLKQSSLLLSASLNASGLSAGNFYGGGGVFALSGLSFLLAFLSMFAYMDMFDRSFLKKAHRPVYSLVACGFELLSLVLISASRICVFNLFGWYFLFALALASLIMILGSMKREKKLIAKAAGI